VPAALSDRPVYDHNPEYTLVRASHEEMIRLGEVMAERLNLAEAPLVIAVPTEGLSIPNVPGGPFWDPAADAAFLDSLRRHIREEFPIVTYERHVNDPEFGREAARLFIELVDSKQ
jgi:uncharacterized protein (UPF0261 family)